MIGFKNMNPEEQSQYIRDSITIGAVVFFIGIGIGIGIGLLF